ncbi:hypothetical protein F3C99_10515 [Vitellibacter sp. q18]|jgi:hypothetical protein|nr:hypothetical protein [Aequorivita lutea]
MNEQQESIWKFLIENAQGINNAVHIEEMAKRIEVPPKGTNNDDVRGWIKDMVMNHAKQIGTCKNGAFIILNEEEVEIAARYVERNNRSGAVRKNGIFIP